MPDLVGRTIGRYHVVEGLGEGGMATVYKAYDTRLERYVALKVIRSGPNLSEQFLKRFEREAKALAQLSHPNIVKVLDYGDFENQPYLVMEYIAGGILKQRMGYPMLIEEAIRVILPMARALGYAHQHKIIHRDVKPANILMTDSGEPMLSDFGIAKILESGDAVDLTGTGVGIGTPEYMAPEQGMGKKVDERADIYALGVVFFELVTGRKPFQADTPMAVVVKHIHDPLPRPRDFVPSIPAEVENIIFTALQKKPEDRYQTMESFARVLEMAITEKPQPRVSLSESETVVREPEKLSSSQPSVVYNYPSSIPASSNTPSRPPVARPISQPVRTPSISTPISSPVKPKKSYTLWIILGVVGIGIVCIIIIGLGGLLANGGSLLFSPSATLIPTRTFTPQPTEMTLPTETPVPMDTGILFQDDFSDPNSGWEVGNYDTGAVGYTSNGTYSVTGSKKLSTMWGVYDEVFDDLVIDVDALQISAPANNNNDYGVVCRIQENGDGYYLIISGDGYYAIQMSLNGTFSSLVDWTASDAVNQGSVSNHVQAVCDGSRIALTLNGTLLAETNDTNFTSGKIGLTATTYEDQPTEIHFDNLAVTGP